MIVEKNAQAVGILGTVATTAMILWFGMSAHAAFALGWCGATMLTGYMVANDE